VDPAVLFGPPEKIRRVTLDTAAALGGVGHILNLGHGILQGTPVENAQLFIETGQQAELAQPRPAVQVG
jgi:uroporphyrinogen decarboxylase